MPYQRITIRGNLGRDPQTRSTNSGEMVVNFSVAVSEKYKGNETTEWFDCVAFGKTADFASTYLTKGASVLIEGKIQTREWEKDGVKRKAIQVIVKEIDMCGGGRKKAEAEPPYEPAQDAGITGADIPF